MCSRFLRGDSWQERRPNLISQELSNGTEQGTITQPITATVVWTTNQNNVYALVSARKFTSLLALAPDWLRILSRWLLRTACISFYTKPNQTHVSPYLWLDEPSTQSGSSAKTEDRQNDPFVYSETLAEVLHELPWELCPLAGREKQIKTIDKAYLRDLN